MIYEKIWKKYNSITEEMISRKLTLSTMESCTSGLIATLITDTEGASAVLKGAYVTYCNEAKVLNGVSEDVIDNYGVYSTETAVSMAEACRRNLDCSMGIGVTGTFSNVDPNNQDSVPGIVYYAICFNNNVKSFMISIPEQKDRKAYKYYTADKIADSILEVLSNE